MSKIWSYYPLESIILMLLQNPVEILLVTNNNVRYKFIFDFSYQLKWILKLL